MKKVLIVIVFYTIAGCSINSKQETYTARDEYAIRDVLKKQIEQWNAGSIDGFMEGYWKDTALSFFTSKGETKGWDSVSARYKRSYNTKAKMGNLTFKDIELSQFRETEIVQTNGTWVVLQEKDTASGKFCLFWQKFKDGWKIVADHTW